MKPLAPRSHLLRHISQARTGFFCCDIQERLRTRIADFSNAVLVSNMMARFHEVSPAGQSVFLATLQYPKGIGPLAEGIELPKDAMTFSKVQNSMLVPEMRPYVLGSESDGLKPIEQAVIWGHETYACVLQTTNELLMNGIPVAVLIDGCGAQKNFEHDVAIADMRGWDGVTVCTSMSAILQLSHNDQTIMKALKAKNLGPGTHARVSTPQSPSSQT